MALRKLVAVTILALATGGLLAAEALAKSGSDWLPLKGSDIRVVCTWSNGCSGDYHGYKALDLGVPHNRTVYASGSGTVSLVKTGCPPYTRKDECNGGAGNYVVVNHGDHYSRYLHLSSASISVGKKVSKGTALGKTGESGWTTFPHLHYDEKNTTGSGGTSYDPGKLKACWGSTLVTYPGKAGSSSWSGIPTADRKMLRNDGYGCDAPPPDSDDDEIPDAQDRCDDLKGIPANDGCPYGPSNSTPASFGPGKRGIISAVTKDGSLYTRTVKLGTGWEDFRRHGNPGQWALASTSVGSDGKYRLLAVTKTGSLYYRSGEPGNDWGDFQLNGEADSWDPSEQPDIATGPDGRIIIAAVKKDGSLYTRTAKVGSGWEDFRRHGNPGEWATASVAIGSDEQYRLLAMSEDGSLYYRVGTPGSGWKSFQLYGTAGSWDPGEQPDVAAGPGKLIISALKKDGSLYTRAAKLGDGWNDFRQHGADGRWASASVAIGSDGDYRVTATDKTGTLEYWAHDGSSWGPGQLLGEAGSWSSHDQPDIGAGPDGELIILAVDAEGTLYSRIGQIGDGWNDLKQQGSAATWETSEPPAVPTPSPPDPAPVDCATAAEIKQAKRELARAENRSRAAKKAYKHKKRKRGTQSTAARKANKKLGKARKVTERKRAKLKRIRAKAC